MGCKGSKQGQDDYNDGGKTGKKLKRTKSIAVDGNRMRHTKSAVFDKPDGTGNQDAEAMTRRTSVLAGAGGKNMAFPDSSPGGKGDHPEITVGVHTHVGDPETHANEDRATAVLDLLGKFAPENVEYQGDDNRMLSFFGVYDGHGGDSCSEYLRKNLHIHCAEGLWTNNTHEKLPASLIKTFEDVEDGPTSRHAPGSCCCTVIIKGRKIYCADAGDSMAVICDSSKGKSKMTKLNDRHGVEFSPQEIKRLRAAKAEIAEDYEMEGAVISRDSRGRFVKALYPTRGFGDADFKDLVAPKPVVISTPTGAGIGYEGAAYECKGPGPYWLMIGCDGLWDFMKEDVIQRTWFEKDTPQAMAEHLVRVAQAPPYSSYDDVTVIVCKLEFPN